MVQDAELGKRFVDKLAKVALLDGSERWVYVHLEVQGSARRNLLSGCFLSLPAVRPLPAAGGESGLVSRHHRQLAAQPVWIYQALGCSIELNFPTAKLLDYAAHQDQLYQNPNPFALVTLAHLLTQTTRQDMNARFAAKWKLVQLLYQRGWDKQR